MYRGFPTKDFGDFEHWYLKGTPRYVRSFLLLEVMHLLHLVTSSDALSKPERHSEILLSSRCSRSYSKDIARSFQNSLFPIVHASVIFLEKS